MGILINFIVMGGYAAELKVCPINIVYVDNNSPLDLFVCLKYELRIVLMDSNRQYAFEHPVPPPPPPPLVNGSIVTFQLETIIVTPNQVYLLIR